MHESSDILRGLGLLALGSRFRRLGERLQAETQAILDETVPGPPASAHPLLGLLAAEGPCTIGRAAKALGVSQPGVTRAVAGLARMGLVEVAPCPEDGRVRRAALSPAGRALVAEAETRAWPRVRRAVADLCAGFDADLLALLNRIEDGMEAAPLRARPAGARGAAPTASHAPSPRTGPMADAGPAAGPATGRPAASVQTAAPGTPRMTAPVPVPAPVPASASVAAPAPAPLSPAASAALDCAPRAALETRHAALAEIAAGARRYPPAVAPFAAADPADPGALARLARPGEVVAFLQATRPETPPGFEELQRAEGVQMLAGAETLRLAAGVGGTGVTALTPADAADMLALAEAARPGPFTLRALALGRFWGLREGGRLVAMAGERFALPGFVEISGVCVAEEARGRGLARRLSLHTAARIAARGDRPFLHAFAANRPALALYDSLGFETRAAMQVGVFRRDPG